MIMDAEKKNAILEKINSGIEMVRPYLKADGGDVEVVDVTDDLSVKVRLKGACEGCPFSLMTLQAGIEKAIREKFPEMKDLISV